MSDINKELHDFYKTLYTQNTKCDLSYEKNLENLAMPFFSNVDRNSCEGALTTEELFDALTSMGNDKSPGNDGLTKEFYVTFWNELKNPFIRSVNESFVSQELTTSQKQAVIKLIETSST